MTTYTISDHNTLTGESPFVALHTFLVNDKNDFNEEFNEEKQEEYLEAAHTLFMLKSKNMHNPDIQISDADEKELSFMLEAILHARRALYEYKYGEL